MRTIFVLLLCVISLHTFAQLPGNSLQLKANGNFASVADAGSVSLNDTMTLEMMLYFRCGNGQSTFLMTKGWCGSTWSYYWSVFDQKLRFARWYNGLTGCSNNHAVFETSDSIPVNTWVHVAVVISDLSVNMYINGVEAGTSLISGNNGDGFHPSNQPIRIGNYVNLAGNNTGTPKANFDEVRIWHVARTPAQLLATMNNELIGNEAGLVAYYKLNESGSGAGISLANSKPGSLLPNGTTNGTATNVFFDNNSTILNALPACDPVLWLKADAGAFTDAGITPANEGQPVQQWNDQSANAFHCAQPDLTKRPVWQANAIYGKPALFFDGVNGNYWLENATQTPVATAGSARTYFVVGKAACNATGYAGGHLFTNRRSPNASTLEFVQNGNGIFHGGNFCCNHPEVTNVNFSQGQQQPFIGTWRTLGTNTNLDFWFNGQSKTTANANFVADNGNAGYCVGDRRDAFQFDNPNGAYDWQGHIAEIIVFNYALSPKDRVQIENYLNAKYSPTAYPAQLTAVASASANNNSGTVDDGVWTHSYNSANAGEIIASVKDFCLDLGTRSDTVYVEGGAVNIGTAYAMRRHYVVQTALNPVGTKRVRLYYTQADFADLQAMTPGLSNHNQLCVTKYDGPSEDGQFNSAGGTLTFIPSNQITTGTAFGQRYLEFDVNGFSEFWIHGPSSVPLPIEGLRFDAAVCDVRDACLTWSAEKQEGLKAYAVERSVDARTFETLARIAADRADGETYTYRDRPAADKVYYRLRTEDHDGAAVYSPVRMLQFDAESMPVLIPNPAHEELTLSGLKAYQSVLVTDMAGTVLFRQTLNGSTWLKLSTAQWPTGLYSVRLSGEGRTEVLRLVVRH